MEGIAAAAAASEAATFRGSTDLAGGRALSLSKALLDNVSDQLTGPQVYKKYFNFFTLADSDTNLSCVKSRPLLAQKIANSLYKASQPAAEPTFFSIHSFHDLSRLSALLDTELVLYQCASEENLSAVQIFYDFRILSSGRPRSSARFFLVTRTRRLFRLTGNLDSAVSYDVPKSRVSNYVYAESRPVGPSWGASLCQLAGLPQPPPHWLRELPGDLQDRRQDLYELWKEPVLVVALCQTQLATTTRRNNNTASRHHFVTLALVGPPVSQLSQLEAGKIQKVVCFLGGGGTSKLCLLSQPFRESVLKQLIKTSHLDKSSERDLLNLTKVAQSEQAEALKKRGKKYATKAELRGTKCRCEICRDTAYASNMAKSGPEKLLTYAPDVTELLHLLGVATTENLGAVERLCELSVASMDIESSTLPLDLSPPVDPATGVRHAVVDGCALEGHSQKIQKPLMISHLDSLMPDSEPAVFVVESDSEEAVYKMMADYWKFVRSRHRECSRRKRELVLPLTELLVRYRLAHEQAHASWEAAENCGAARGPPGTSASRAGSEREEDKEDDDPPDSAGSWRQSVPGQLQKALDRLVTNYAVFSFYG